MSTLRGKCISSYHSRGTGKKMFVYSVTGSEEDIQKYLEIQRKRFPSGKWEDENGVYYWTSAPSGASIQLDITINDNVVENTMNLDLQAASAARYDYTYETIKESLKGATGAARVVREQPEPEKKEEPVNNLED